MKLYFFPVAPNPTKVRLYLAEKKAGGSPVDLHQELVNLPKGEQRGETHLARNPLGKLPVLELDDGRYLTESLAIIEYIEELFPNPPLIGRSARQRAFNRELERLADLGVLGNVARWVHATRSPLGLPPNPAVAEASRDALPAPLKILDAGLADGRPFLAGDGVGVADCTLQAAFQFARFAELSLLDDYEHLSRWDRDYRARESAQSVLVR
jgi:glutathione S-transferase